ncbi:MAG TPA: imidazoleglycerol-phosphate dehydratase HisB [Tepidisphaeraceae bacterium]|jgi:imidazoleglycerol-phosphate dehydratase
MPTRTATISRSTSETQIKLTLGLDGTGVAAVRTGVGFFDHMLDLLARHGLFDLAVEAAGDLHVDQHHTVEDVGITFGQALEQCVGEKRGISRYGFFSLPMDESLANVALDLSGRPALVFDVPFKGPLIGEFAVELVEEFFKAVATTAKMNLHVTVPYGTNNHHMAEAIFKAFARSLRQAVSIDERARDAVPSTKGSLTV